MKICRTIDSLAAALDGQPDVGFVPTMGFLHDGHLSLVRACRRESGLTVVSIFVNPAQFGPGEDLERYPRDAERDMAMLEKERADVLFLPAGGEIYPPGHATAVSVQGLDAVLCGASRPGHFRGVATVVLKLFNLVRPQRAYFGQKDAQQAIIVRRLVRDLHLPVRVRVMPIVRDADGLALSSRNVYLSAQERQAALALPRALSAAGALVAGGELDAARLKAAMAAELAGSPLVETDYLAVASLDDLAELAVVRPGQTLIAAAVRVGATRLIDNLLLGELA
jgi:pantoate--beta-alanine ligase